MPAHRNDPPPAPEKHPVDTPAAPPANFDPPKDFKLTPPGTTLPPGYVAGQPVDDAELRATEDEARRKFEAGKKVYEARDKALGVKAE